MDNRDREIERLNRLLDGGRSFDVVSMEANMRNNDKLISHQNLQVGLCLLLFTISASIDFNLI